MNKGLKNLLRKILEGKSAGVMMIILVFFRTGYLMRYVSIG